MGQGPGGTACAYGGDLFLGNFCLPWEFSPSLQISSHAQSILPDISGNGSFLEMAPMGAVPRAGFRGLLWS